MKSSPLEGLPRRPMFAGERGKGREPRSKPEVVRQTIAAKADVRQSRDPKGQSVTLRFEDELVNRVDLYAKSRSMNRSEAIRELVKRGLG